MNNRGYEIMQWYQIRIKVTCEVLFSSISLAFNLLTRVYPVHYQVKEAGQIAENLRIGKITLSSLEFVANLIYQFRQHPSLENDVFLV